MRFEHGVFVRDGADAEFGCGVAGCEEGEEGGCEEVGEGGGAVGAGGSGWRGVSYGEEGEGGCEVGEAVLEWMLVVWIGYRSGRVPWWDGGQEVGGRRTRAAAMVRMPATGILVVLLMH